MASGRQGKSAGRTTRDQGSLGVVSQIDRRLSELDRELESVSELMAERRRLLAARQALTGERVSSGADLVRRVSQYDVAPYLAEHPRSRAGQITPAVGGPFTA